MTIRVAVAGASGYAGGELVRVLAGHPRLTLDVVTASASAGQQLAEVHPNLRSLGDWTLQPTTPEVLADADLVFLALPHGASGGLGAALAADQRVVDLGADHRLVDSAAWERYYGGTPRVSWTYGLPELAAQRAAVAGSTRVANPGCFPTAVTLALAPLAAAGLIDVSDVVVVAASGSSGAGRSASPALLGSELMGSAAAYKVGGAHQHTPEMEQTLGLAGGQPATVSFTPILVPMARGIVATCTARLSPAATPGQVREAMSQAYQAEPFVSLLPEGTWPRTNDVSGSNAAALQVVVDAHAERVVVVCAIDNLGKGAAGQAVQNANLMLGLDECAGLSALGVAP
ncbi:MAG: N-acetyl-gamma-glutamyl-phosphate reductase [Actinomycetes bacterium]